MTDQLSVLLAVGSLGLGGAERQCVELACSLRAGGHLVEVVYLNGASRQLLPLLERATVPTTLFQGRFPGDPRLFRMLFGFIRERRFQVVHTFLFTAGYTVRPVAWLAGVPVIVHGERMGDYRRPHRQHFVDKALARITDHFVANSSQGADYLRERLGVKSRKVSVILNGIDLGRFSNSAREVPRWDVLMVGRLWPQKNYSTALEVLARVRSVLPRTKMAVAGGIARGDQALMEHRERLRRRASLPDLEGAIEWLGYRVDVPDLLAVTKVFLSTSYHEGCPNSVMEAMAAGIPVVVPAISDLPTIVRDGIDGFVVENHDVRAFVRALSRLLRDDQLRRVMGENARLRARDFGVEELARQHERLYHNLLSRSGMSENPRL